MSNDNLNLPHLVRVCEAATPGEWIPWVRMQQTASENRSHGSVIGPTWISVEKSTALSPEDAVYVGTFNPSTVLALLRRLMEAEAQVQELNAALEKANTPLQEASHEL